MTLKEYFDLLIASAGDGTFPAVRGPGEWGVLVCRYRTPDGHRCAIGVLIPPEKYVSFAEGRQPLEALAVCGVAPPEGVSAEDLLSVQSAHDDIALKGEWNPESFKRRLTRIPCFAPFLE